MLFIAKSSLDLQAMREDEDLSKPRLAGLVAPRKV